MPSTLSRTASRNFAMFCAADPAQTSCSPYETAVSGVAFEQFEGGTLSPLEQSWLLDYKENSGFTFLAMLVIGVFASYAMVGMLGAASASTVAGATTATNMGGWGSLLSQAGAITSSASLAGGVAVEAAILSGGLVLGGGNLGSTFDSNLGSVLVLAQVSKGVATPTSLTGYSVPLNSQVTSAMTADMVAGTLTGVAATVTGGCALGSLAQECVGQEAGVISRPDELTGKNDFEFNRENSGRLVRSRTLGMDSQ